MRLDLVLKQTNLIKRRTIAKQLVDLGKVLINGKVSKPSSIVKENDILTLNLGSRTIIVKITFTLKGKRIIPQCVQVE